MARSAVGGVAGVDVDHRPRDSSLPRVYEDPDELASSNQVLLKAILTKMFNFLKVEIFIDDRGCANSR